MVPKQPICLVFNDDHFWLQCRKHECIAFLRMILKWGGCILYSLIIIIAKLILYHDIKNRLIAFILQSINARRPFYLTFSFCINFPCALKLNSLELLNYHEISRRRRYSQNAIFPYKNVLPRIPFLNQIKDSTNRQKCVRLKSHIDNNTLIFNLKFNSHSNCYRTKYY